MDVFRTGLLNSERSHFFRACIIKHAIQHIMLYKTITYIFRLALYNTILIYWFKV